MDWRTLRVSADGTRHEVSGVPAYEAHFDEVLPFHVPGLAPVRLGAEAWHITAEGKPAYPARFRRTFGFYDNRAAVIASDGWHHILPSGDAAYEVRYSWCGNYQEQLCPVRTVDGCFHIDLDGVRVYAHTWRYAGDFRGGVAVIQRDDGRSSHIDACGELLHDAWFLDLDVFHKGFARARFDDGWAHVDRSGLPAYARRFAMIEPFYNGQARVERLDGGLEIVDEIGSTLVELRSSRCSEFATLSGDIVGYWRSEAICAAVEAGVFDQLPASVAEVAARCGLVPERASRLLRALGELGLVETNNGTWSRTGRGDLLREDHPLSLAGAAIEFTRHLASGWVKLPGALERDSSWTPHRVFDEIASMPERIKRHSRMLHSYAGFDYAGVPSAIGLRGDETIIDAGGGTGALSALLLKRHPGLKAVLLERPEVARIAEVEDAFASRFQVLAADIFKPWPVTGDCVLLARVLHDWEDDLAIQVLRNAREALRRDGRIFLVEMVLPDEGFSGGLCDLHLMLVNGGRERTRKEFADLLDSAGFAFVCARTTTRLPAVIEGRVR